MHASPLMQSCDRPLYHRLPCSAGPGHPTFQFGSIYSMKRDGSDVSLVATGALPPAQGHRAIWHRVRCACSIPYAVLPCCLTMTAHAAGVRNTVGFDFHPLTGKLYFTDNGRDVRVVVGVGGCCVWAEGRAPRMQRHTSCPAPMLCISAHAVLCCRTGTWAARPPQTTAQTGVLSGRGPAGRHTSLAHRPAHRCCRCLLPCGAAACVTSVPRPRPSSPGPSELNVVTQPGQFFGFPFCHTGPAGGIDERPYLRAPGVGPQLVDPDLNRNEAVMKCNGGWVGWARRWHGAPSPGAQPWHRRGQATLCVLQDPSSSLSEPFRPWGRTLPHWAC